MYKLFPIISFFPKPSYLLFITCLFLYSSLLPGQKKTPAKSGTSKKGSKRVIYGTASFYANKFNGRKTASGELFSQDKLTCASNMLPLGTWIKITNVRNGKTVIVKVNDRMHPRMRRLVDLSRAAARKLGYTAKGLVRVKVEVLGKKKPG